MVFTSLNKTCKDTKKSENIKPKNQFFSTQAFNLATYVTHYPVAHGASAALPL